MVSIVVQGKIIKSNLLSLKIPRSWIMEWSSNCIPVCNGVQTAFLSDEKCSDCKTRTLDFLAVACLPVRVLACSQVI